MSVIKGHGAGEVSGDFYSYKINQSVRFEDGSSHHLTRTPSGDGNRKTWTYSFWFKHGSKTTMMDFLLANGASDPFFAFALTAAGKFQLFYHNETMLVSTAVLRDRSAWYHIVARHDTTQSTADNRFRVYVNGSELTAWDTNGRANLPQDFDGGVNQAIAHFIGQSHVGGNTLDGYMAELHLVDGSSLAPSSFGETKDGIWVPVEYSGSHGTNGFYLPFDDGSAIGDDESSNTNDLTANNFAATDVVKDSPTNNFCTLNPLDAVIGTIAEGNLSYNHGSAVKPIRSTFHFDSGKWYWEVRASGNGSETGLALSAAAIGGSYATYNFARYSFYNGTKRLGSSSSASYHGSGANADEIYGFAADMDNGTLTVYKNNSSLGQLHSWTPDGTFYAVHIDYATTSSGADVFNFGQDSSFAGAKTAGNNADGNGVGDFFYSPPSGFLALCSANLDTPAIIDGTEHFNAVLYTAASSNGTYNITGNGFQPDFSWVKNRDDVERHLLFDSVRGNTSMTDKFLVSSATSTEGANGVTGTTVTVNADGMQIVESSIDSGELYFNSRTYVMWNWLAATAFSNDASATSVGTIDSSGQVNTTAGFSIVSYTGNDTNNATVGHGLSSAPEMIIARARNEAENWVVYHKDITPASNSLSLNLNIAAASFGSGWIDNATSTVFRLKDGASDRDNVNKSSSNYIAYCFHSVEGYSKVGSFTGNANSDGPFVYTGGRVQWLLLKNASASENWYIWDNAREPINIMNERQHPNLAIADQTSSGRGLDFLSNGFKIRGSDSSVNGSGNTIIYLAIMEQPFKFSNSR